MQIYVNSIKTGGYRIAEAKNHSNIRNRFLKMPGIGRGKVVSLM